GEEDELVSVDAGVDLRVLAERERGGLDDEVVVRDRARFSAFGFPAVPQLAYFLHVYVDHLHDVRHGRPGFGHAARGGAANGSEAAALADAAAAPFHGINCRLRRYGGSLDIRLGDETFGTGAGDDGEIDAALFGEPPRFRRCADSAAGRSRR